MDSANAQYATIDCMNDIRTDVDTGKAVPKPAPAKKKINIKKTLTPLLVLVLLAAAAGAGYWWRDRDAKKLDTYRNSQITTLEGKNSLLEKDLAAEKAKNETASKKATATAGPTDSTLGNVKDSISSGNTAALEGYMATKVLVILAASEGIGTRSASQAVSDITSYLKEATNPWDFDLADAALNSYSQGDYSQYFPSGSLVGQSKNDYVISFSFNNAGKISVVFMSVSADLL